MLQPFLIIRLKQIFRGLKALGLFRFVLVLGLLGSLGFTLMVHTSKTPNVYYSAIIYIFTIAATQIKRKDKIFLKTQTDNYKSIYFLEYTLLAVPLILLLLYNSYFSVAGLTILASGVISNIELSTKRRYLDTKLRHLIPAGCFEWQAGFRKLQFLILPVWAAGLFTSFFIGSAPIAIFILGVIPLGFYETGEPLQMLLAFEMNTNKFLLRKIKLQAAIFSILSIPLILAFLVFHPGLWYIPVAVYIVFLFLQAYFILTKYAFYEPDKKSGGAQIFGALGVMGSLFPVFLPVVWILAVRFYFKAKANLNFYLNDYN